MKKMKLICIAMILMLPFLLHGKDRYWMPGFEWESPQMMAMGGASLVDTSGFAALSTNPANFANEEAEYTLLAFKFEAVTDPFALFNKYIDGSISSDIPTLIQENITENGMGLGFDIGMGWVGKGFGVGLFQNTEIFFPQEDMIINIRGALVTDTVLVLGYGYNFSLFNGDVQLNVGADIRPMYRVSMELTFSQAMFAMGQSGGESFNFMTMPALAGGAIAFDLGTVAYYKTYSLGLVLRDIGNTRYNLRNSTLEEVFQFSGSGSSGEYLYITPISLAVGAGWQPNMGSISWLVKPRVEVTYKTPLILGYDKIDLIGYQPQTFLSKLHFGAEAKFFSVIYLRAGLNGGYFTAGTGVDFRIGEFNLAVYSEENGPRAGQQQQLAANMELRFHLTGLGKKKNNTDLEE